jgi:hypothetical protein
VHPFVSNLEAAMTRTTVVSVILLMLSAAPLAATPQNSRADLAVSWGLLATSEEEIPVGWLAAFGGHVNDWLTIVGEVGGNYKSINEFGINLDLSEHAFLGGARFWLGEDRRVRPFFQVLAGISRASAGADVFGLSIDVSNSFFTIQPGGGVDIGIMPRTAIRIQGDFRSLTSGQGTTQFRLATGVAFGLGRR